MVIEPMPGGTLAREPSPPFSQGIQEDRQEHAESKKAELDADRTAGLQDGVFRRKWTRRGIQRVVIPPVNQQGEDQGNGEQVSDDQTNTMGSFSVEGWGDYGCDRCIRAHCFATCSSVLTENRL